MFVQTVCQCEFLQWASEALCPCGHRCFYEALFVPEDILGESGSEGLNGLAEWASSSFLSSVCSKPVSHTKKRPWSRVPKFYLLSTGP